MLAAWDSDVRLLIEDLRPYVDAPARAATDARPTRDASSVADAHRAVDAAVLCDSSDSGKLAVETTEVPARRSRIFISYRHEVDEYAVGRLAEELRQHFPRDQVFEDIASIDPGADFVDALRHGLNTCAAVLVVIGPNWVTVTDRQGRRRLDLPDDWVRYEVAESLRNPGVRVFPLLLDAEMPSADELPEFLRPLTRRQAFPLTGRHWPRTLRSMWIPGRPALQLRDWLGAPVTQFSRTPTPPDPGGQRRLSMRRHPPSGMRSRSSASESVALLIVISFFCTGGGAAPFVCCINQWPRMEKVNFPHDRNF